MKIIKRGFGILMVIALVFTLLAPTAIAAVKPGYLMSIRVRALNSKVNAGDIVTFVVSLNSKPEFPMWSSGEYDVGFNSSYFSMTDDWNQDMITDGYAYEGLLDINSWTYDAYLSEPSAEEMAEYDWDNYVHLGLIDGTGTFIDVSNETEIFAFNVRVNPSTPDGVYYVGLGYNGYDAMTSYTNEQAKASAWHGFGVGLDYGLSDPDSPLYDLSEAVVAITVGDTATDPVVTNNGVKVQWDKDASHVKLGYKATISDLALTTTFNATTNAYEVNELSEVGVIFSTTIENPTLADVGNGATKATCNTLYDNKDGTYSFRTVVRNAAIDNTTTLNSVMYITLADGTTSYYSLSGTTSPKAAYDAGRLNGMPDFGA